MLTAHHRWPLAAAGALALVASTAGAASATGPRTWVVQPGESIQAAVDQASSGDTVKIEAGTYQEAVCVDGKGLEVVGAGAGATSIVWPEWATAAELPAVATTACWTAEQGANRASDPATLADDVSALFFLNPDGPVRVCGLSTQNHPANGIAAWGADGLTVGGTENVGHARNGVLAAASTKTRIVGNVVRGTPRPEAELPADTGVSVADSAAAEAIVAGNEVTGHTYAIYVREARGGVLRRNTLTDNCTGIRIFDDSSTLVPDTTQNVEAGAWKVTGNTSVANNRYCVVNPVVGQFTSGVGMSVSSADDILIAGNEIRGNAPFTPEGGEAPDFASAGLVLVGLRPIPFPPGRADPGTVENIRVVGNTILDNQPLDIRVSRPTGSPQSLVREPGEGLVFEDNDCAVSLPAEICAA